MTLLASLISVLLLFPYFGWGIFTLRMRFRYHEGLSATAEIITVVSVAFFFTAEMYLLHAAMRDLLVMYLFTGMGLVVSGVALYGHMLVSLMSQLFVGMIMPAEPKALHEPRFGPAEALERLGDYEGAVQEYLIIARIFPSHATTALRVGDNFTHLEDYEAAAKWFDRGLKLLSDAETGLSVMNRLAEIHTRKLQQPDEALRIMEDYVTRYPGAPRVESVRERISRLREEAQAVAAPIPSEAPEIRELDLD